ncbi:hypothetical protein [Streptomyces sp. NEAU-S7GS2]|uniref:hypothetical protein n=1 Tax=Streptomyces sp. NEAU-S7GS2 TaxID=2202000 RepID=UPI000D6FEC3D|nr:hypothetical protein [Streptomyces sp. NEAU-S7GS2]AWN32602.1 hypothetical protein DKG71_42235 [Streptomyces sp. NEAU-S7GS2]
MREQIRTVLRWPLYSPRRLVAVLVAVVVLLCVINSVNNSSPKKPTADAKPSPAAPAPSSPAPSSSPPAAPSASPDLGVAVDVSKAFVSSWASHDKKADWLKALKPLCTERLAAKLSTTDPSRIEAKKVRGARVTDTGGGALTSAAVETDAGPVTVGLVWTGVHWLVRDIEPGAQAAR